MLRSHLGPRGQRSELAIKGCSQQDAAKDFKRLRDTYGDLLRSNKLRADSSLGNASERLHCHRSHMACCLLPVEKLGALKQRKSSTSEMLLQDHTAIGVTWLAACCARINCARTQASEMLPQDYITIGVTWLVACCARINGARTPASEVLPQDYIAVGESWFVAGCA